MKNYTTENLVPVSDAMTGVPAIRIGNLVFPMVSGLNFYKCAFVDPVNSKWSGYKAVFVDGVYCYESILTADRTYGSGFTPEVGSVYSDGALIKAELYEGSNEE